MRPPHRRCVPAPAAAGGASVHCVAPPCTGGGASLHRLPCSADASCAAVEIRKNDLEGVEGKPSGLRESLTPGAVLGSVQQPSSSGSSLRPGFEAVKARHTGWGAARKTRFQLLVCARTSPVWHFPTVRRRSRGAAD